MTVYNHVEGGIVFTGTFCSLFNVNIFEDKISLFVCIFAAILPDIDHTKSLIGKIFYPVSKAIYRNFGHRTITHSLLIFGVLSLIFGVFEGFFSSNPHLYLIFIFAYFSHLVLDMITVAGIPLFYPFYKNPCVIPANPKLRLRTGNLKSEGVMLFIFSILTFTFQPLFSNGFWSTYNQNFGTISHINREFSRSNQVLELDYVFQYFGEVFAGTGIILESNRYQIRVLNNDNLIVINKDENTQIKSLEFRHKDSIYAVQKHNFVSISPDSLATYFDHNYILEGDIFGNSRFIYDNSEVFSFSIKRKFSPKIPKLIPINHSKSDQIQLKISQELIQINAQKQSKNDLINEKNALKSEISTASNYRKNKIVNRLKSIKNDLNSFKIDYSRLKSLQIEQKQLKPIQKTTFSGSLKILHFQSKTAKNSPKLAENG